MTARKTTTTAAKRPTPAQRAAAELAARPENQVHAPPTLVQDITITPAGGGRSRAIRGALGFQVCPEPLPGHQGQAPKGMLMIHEGDGAQTIYAPGQWESFTSRGRQLEP